MRAFVMCAVLVVLGLARVASAQTTPVTDSNAKTWVGGELDLMLAGQIDTTFDGVSGNSDAATAFGFGGVLDYRASPWITIGLAPRFVIGVQPNNGNASSNQLDLRARVTIGNEVAPRLRLYGIGTIGYSWIFDIFRDDLTGDQYNSDGFIWSLGVGVSYAINHRLRFTGEISYQFGYQGGSVDNFNFTVSDNFLTLGIGLMTPIE
jgi:hypothetical protein